MRQVPKFRRARAAAACLAFVASAAMAAPGLGQEQGKSQEQELSQQPQEQEKEKTQERRRRRAEGPDQRGPAARAIRSIGHELHLSREQQRSLRELVRVHADELRNAARGIGEARAALREQALADTFDEAAIRSSSEQLGAAIGSVATLTARLASEIRPALTPRQRERLRRLSSRWERRRGRFEGWN